jgi:hypothetical protein
MSKKLNVEIQILATKENGELVSRIKTAGTPGMKTQERAPMIIQALISSYVEMVNVSLNPDGAIKCFGDAKAFIDIAIERAKINSTQINPSLN